VGKEMLETVVTATGLPDELINEELNMLVAKAGLKPEEMTLDDLRMILAEYVQDVLLAAKEDCDKEQAG
jgi:hypothetical protein